MQNGYVSIKVVLKVTPWRVSFLHWHAPHHHTQTPDDLSDEVSKKNGGHGVGDAWKEKRKQMINPRGLTKHRHMNAPESAWNKRDELTTDISADLDINITLVSPSGSPGVLHDPERDLPCSRDTPVTTEMFKDAQQCVYSVI